VIRREAKAISRPE